MIGMLICKCISSRVSWICSKMEKEQGCHIDIVLIGNIEVEDLLPCDIVVVEWELRHELFKVLQKMVKKNIVFFNDTFFLNLDDTDEAKGIIEIAMSQKKWEVCKGMNEFLLYGDIIRRRVKLHAFPRKLQLETTDVCNAKCIMCSHAYSAGTGMDIFESKILEKLAPYLPYLRTIVLHGNGEPFIKPNIIQYLDYLSQYGIFFVTNTNLSIINDAILERLNRNFEEISVSCDAHCKELYESIRVGLYFDTFVQNVIWVRENCPNLHMNMAVIVMRQNLPYLDKIVEFAANLGFQTVQFNQLCVDLKCNNFNDSPILYKEEYVEAIKKIIAMAKKKHIAVTYPNITEIKEEKFTKIDKQNYHDHIQFEGICDWLVESPFINLRGDVGICCINARDLMGNIFETDFGEIWNSDAYCAMREDFYKMRVNPICKGCDFMMHGRLQYLKLINADLSALKKRSRE